MPWRAVEQLEKVTSSAGARHMTYKYNRNRHTSRSDRVSSAIPDAPLKPNLALKFEVIYCVRGVVTDPCGLPVFGSDHVPSSITPAFNHFWISRRMRGSATRCSTNFISQLLSKLSKKLAMSASKM